MPELPEVEVMVNQLKGILGHTITGATVIRNNNRYLSADDCAKLVGAEILDVRRIGKFVIFDLDIGKIVCHNAMSGYWDTSHTPWTYNYVEGRCDVADENTRVFINLLSSDDGTKNILKFHDKRLFGSIKFYNGIKDDAEIKSLSELGPDALNEWTMADLEKSCAFSKMPIKQALMRQRWVSGIGNVYASEALYRAQIDPRKISFRLTLEEVHRIYIACQKVLRQAIYEKLDYGKYLLVYKKKNCGKCNTIIRRHDIAKRNTYYCTGCQK